MNWTEVNIYTTSEGVDPLCGRLLLLGINGFVIRDSKDFEEFLLNKEGNWDYIDEDLMGLKDCETCVTIYLPENSQGADMLASLREETARLLSEDLEKKFGSLKIELSNIREEDWANNWKQYFKPLRIGKRLVVKPSWENLENKDGRIVLEIDPASSFGTGQHNTTKLCLELLEKTVKNGDRVLDLGCGSGILSIAAVLFGAGEAFAVDIEQNAVETAIENARKNGIPDEKYHAFCGNVLCDDELVSKLGGGFDIIAANIVADVLIGMSHLFPRFLKPGGLLLMSGIISERKDEVVDAAKEQGFSLLSVNENEGWAAVLMQNSQGGE
ncbi:MAG: ribosomal protein methyltransferase [Oscillospiraceae bacterium]|jgi:ribosomal protein L11 methyltransferase|nr:ribosomal protein methyltransferase [Oscillospiraceae bacterium]